MVEATVQQNATSHQDTKNVLANFMENVLGIEDAKDIEFQRVHRMGKPRMDGSGGRTIIARFLRFPDREREFLNVDVNSRVRITRCLRKSPKNYMN